MSMPKILRKETARVCSYHHTLHVPYLRTRSYIYLYQLGHRYDTQFKVISEGFQIMKDDLGVPGEPLQVEPSLTDAGIWCVYFTRSRT